MFLRIINDSPDKDCGECSACCDVVGVQELGKPYYARCKHLDANCSIYLNRPDTCRKYRCAWHRGLLGDSVDRRPDRCGFLLDLNQTESGELTIDVFEATPGALGTGRHQFLIQKLHTHRKLKEIAVGERAVNVYPFGSKVHITFDASADYDWTPPAGEVIEFDVDLPDHPDQGIFRGETTPLIMPKRSSE